MIAAPRQRLVVVGNGMAGMRVVQNLLRLAPHRYDITVFGAEPHPNYDRIALSSVLAGEKTLEEIVINSRDWYAENGIRLIAGDPVVAIDRMARTVTSASGVVAAYDRLLIAAGSKPLAPPIPGLGLPGTCAFRDIADVETMIAAARDEGRRAVVIGGGLLGLEAAWGLRRRGMSVALVHLMPTLMERQLDATAGTLLQRDLDRRGIAFFTNGQTEEITGTDRATGVRLADGREVPADLVVVAIGIRPNIDLARQAGLEVNRGIVVDDGLRTEDPNIFAVGECVEHRGQVFGLVAPIWEQAKICAAQLAGDETAIYVTPPLSTRLKITGVDVFSAGALAAADPADEEITFQDVARGVYRKLVLRGGKVAGVVMYGDVTDGPWYFQLLREGTEVGPMRDTLILGRAVATAAQGAPAHDPAAAVAALPDTAEICGCNGVCKGSITAAIAELKLTTLDAVRAHTKASASCGSCTGQVEALLAAALGEGYAKPEGERPMCKCTSHGHDHVRREILARGLKTIPEVMLRLGWTRPEGCASCRPALNYYLLCAWPGEYEDDARSRFVNERMHANIQKDGTYSVVPRMWGGLTNPRELRAIADVVEKYNIPEVKVTGGQRIDLFGVKREQLPHVWRDLNAAGMVSGHAYAKGLRTVKTCVGSTWCRFGTQDSTGMGVALERMAWGSWHPHKVKLAVSGCPRNCAEATIKDFGVVAVESGWELHVGGNGGIHVRATDLLCRVATEAEVLEHCGAFLQLYREEARYLERTAPWVERVGIDYVRRRVVEDVEGRRALHERFLHAQRFAQQDPWAERAAGADAGAFSTLVPAE
ncbi:nitrite reductase large subunit NirB [Siccirubricoccus sp. KC 17139]|uniref:Nitrite reductase large subunit NirB n=1 Tax=Siccirubricoccus soli TaxID=2899147 RepID=A0ABT1D940_9PROT|nr:nitrite reductase large subunit NirB [Siccirubricoccus soli]MCO6418460.1 nitrite reductase large subunit NirB [Siccirubricoccus soli]MCP2684595.1 nitrite reductase large subunit NirB [Siccirubricoccus soli]